MLGEQRLAATLLLSGGLCGSRGALTARAAASPGRRKLSCGPAASRSGRITSALLRRRPPPPRHETCPASQRSGVRSVAAGQGQSRGGAAGGCPLGLAPSPKERGAKAAPPRGRARRHRETPRWRPRAPRAAASQPAPCPGRKRPLQPASKPQGGGGGGPARCWETSRALRRPAGSALRPTRLHSGRRTLVRARAAAAAGQTRRGPGTDAAWRGPCFPRTGAQPLLVSQSVRSQSTNKRSGRSSSTSPATPSSRSGAKRRRHAEQDAPAPRSQCRHCALCGQTTQCRPFSYPMGHFPAALSSNRHFQHEACRTHLGPKRPPQCLHTCFPGVCRALAP